MASPEQLASLWNDNNSDDSSSSSGSSSSGDGSNDSASKRATDQTMDGSASPAKESLPVPTTSSSSSSSLPREPSTPRNTPAKKRLKLGFDVDETARNGEENHRDTSSNSRLHVEVNTKEMATHRCADALPVAQPQTAPPIKERVSAEGMDSRGDNTTSGVHEDAHVEVGSGTVKEDDKSIEIPVSADHSRVESAIDSGTTTNTTKTRTRPTTPSMKPIRFPPMSSPGLLTSIPPAGAFRETVDPSTGLATPAAIFEHAMSLAGYTLENRTKKPHRGSSVQRVVDDMFDSNVKFTLHFPSLMPEGLLDDAVSEKLMQAFRSAPSHSKKRRLPGFSEMAPKSLTIPYPEEYIRRRLEYVEKVTAR